MARHLAPRPSVRALASCTALCLVAALTAAAPRHGGSSGHALEYGMNPSTVSWSSRAIVFADAMARAAEFGRVVGTNVMIANAPTIPLGMGLLGEGWPDFAALRPGERVGAKLFYDMEGSLPDGMGDPYVLTWNGSGSCRLSGAAVAGEANRTANRVEALVDPNASNGIGQLSLVFDESDPSDPVRDVHVWLPGMESEHPLFWPPYLAKVEAMNAGHGPTTWRTLEWSRVNEYGKPLQLNGAFVFDLAGVIRPGSPSQGTRRGVCVEYQVAFCNAVGADLHLLVPHRTQHMSVPDYLSFLTDVFTRVRDGSAAVPGTNRDEPFAGLDPSLTLTIELSNEMWNPGLPVHNWMVSQAQLSGQSPVQQIADEIEQMFDVAASVFTGPDAERLRLFVGGWNAQIGFATGILNAFRDDFRVDALGPVVYMKPLNATVSDWLDGATPGGDCPNCPTPQQVVAAGVGSIDVLRGFVHAHRLLADGYANPDGSHPRLELYEAGHSFDAGFQPWRAAALAAQLLPELYDAYVDELVPMLVEEGVEAVNWYSFMGNQDPNGSITPYGTWNDMDQEITLPVPAVYVDEGAPKVAAIYRGSPLASSCAGASATFRSGGTNPASYTATPPRIGNVLELSVDLTTTGHAFALPFGLTGEDALALGGGQLLLVQDDSGLGNLLGLEPRPGPVATYTVQLPNDGLLCGASIHTQVLHFGDVMPFALSNAQDLVLGP